MPDDEGSHRQIGDELPVHHVSVNPVRARGLAGLQDFAKVKEIR
jgi:hypothetical protein